MMNGQNDVEMGIDTIYLLLKRAGISPTAQRVEIARLLLSKEQHLSADQVLTAVNQKQNLVSKATVYNTLNLFAEKGLVKEVIIDPNKIFYDSNTSEHFHFYNEDNGELMDMQTDELKISGMPKLPKDTVKTGIDVILRVKNK